MRLEQIRAQGEHPPRGGAAQPVAGEQRTVLVVSGTNAWSETGKEPAPQNNTAGDRSRMLWATPHGVIKAAMANNGTLDGNTIKFTVGGREFTATVNAQNLVEKVALHVLQLGGRRLSGRGHLFGLCRFRRRDVPAASCRDPGRSSDPGHQHPRSDAERHRRIGGAGERRQRAAAAGRRWSRWKSWLRASCM